jgi:hypothetical protein
MAAVFASPLAVFIFLTSSSSFAAGVVGLAVGVAGCAGCAAAGAA